MATITDAEFTEAMKQAVELRGKDFVYPDEWRNKDESGHPMGCRYEFEGKGACIIGTAIEIATGETVPDTLEGLSAEVVLENFAPELGKNVVNAAMVAQDVQDANGSWGLALERYLEEL